MRFVSLFIFLIFQIVVSDISGAPERQALGPLRRVGEDGLDDRHFLLRVFLLDLHDDLVVDVEDYVVAVGVEGCQDLAQAVPCDGLRDVLGELKASCEKEGLTFNEDTDVVCEEFTKVFPILS